MATLRSMELAEVADRLDEQGKDGERAGMLRQLASYGAYASEDETSATVQATTSKRVGLVASEVEEIEQNWLWDSWMPEGLFGLFAGDSGVGKSSVMRELIRRLTRGELLPDGQQCQPCGVILISYEEPTRSKLIPALRAAGCDLSKIKILTDIKPEVRTLGEPSTRKITFPEDLGVLRAAIEDDEFNCALVVIDPIMQMTTQSLSHGASARRLLSQMQELAQDTSVSILAINHINKGRNKDIKQRMSGSKELYNYPRYIMAADQDASNPGRYTMWMDKAYREKPASLTYERTSTGGVRFLDGYVEDARADFEQAEELRTDQAIIAYLAARPGQEFQARQIGYGVHVTYDAVRQQLSRLTIAGRIVRNARGLYSAKIVTGCHKSETASQADADDATKVLSQASQASQADDKTVLLDDKTVLLDDKTVILSSSNGAHPVPMR